MNYKDQAQQSWAKLLNPEVLRSNLIGASMFLTAFEILKQSVVERIKSFYSNEFRDGKWIPSENYKTKCLALDKKRVFRASLLWLKEMSVIEDADLTRIDAIREHRDELAHDLPKFLGTAGAEVNIQLLDDIYELITKVDRWWIREVEMTTDPDFDGREVSDEDITSGGMLFVQMMIRVATGSDSGAYWEEFKRNFGEPKQEKKE